MIANSPASLPSGAFLVSNHNCVFQMYSSIVKFNRWVDRNLGLYMALCFLGGSIIRWYWVGQDIHRFINPLAPIFM